MNAENQKNKPKGLYVLFSTEVWDRFIFYGIQALLVIYLTKIFLFSDDKAYSLYGAYTTLAFSLPLLGGFLADRFIGYQRAITNGIFLVFLGAICLVFQRMALLYVGLSCIICGVGLFKANNASLLGQLYRPHDTHKESGFTLFYMGMNLGAILGPIVLGLILNIGWKYTFGFSALGAMLSLVIFTVNKKHFTVGKIYILGILKNSVFYSGVIVFLIALTLLLQSPHFIIYLLSIVGIVVLSGIMYFSVRFNRIERNKIGLLLILDIFSIAFFACSLQITSSLMLFIHRDVNTSIFHFKIPPEAFASLEPLFVIVAAPVFAPLWTYLEKKRHTPTVITRVILALLLGATSFFFFAWAAHINPIHNINLPMMLIIAGNVFLGIGELFIGPGLIAAVTYLIPEQLRSTFMGIWYLSIAFSAYFASVLAKFVTVTKATLQNNQLIYYHGFLKTAFITLGIALLAFMVTPILKHLRGPNKLPQ